MGTVAEPRTVVVTGFGPFGNHVVNASWVSVQELEKLGIADGVTLIVTEMAVEYDTVKRVVPELWEKHKPDLVVHVGVSGIAKELTLEQQAHNDGYTKLDVKGCLPKDSCCVGCCQENEIVSGLNMQVVCDDVNKSDCGVRAVVSQDPGRYLCDFSYFTSLNIDRGHAAFIHVPPLDKPYSALQLAHGLKAAINAMLKQIS